MIDDLRAEIDEIDEQLVTLLNRRTETALEIGRQKRKDGRTIADREREEKVLDRVRRLNGGPLADQQLARIYRTLISETKSIQMKEVGADDSGNEAGSD